MVTSKKRVNAYVDDASYDAFQKWCNGHGCSDSKGVELLIKEHLLGVTQNQVTGNVPDNLVTQESFEAAIAELRNEFNDKMGDFRSEFADIAVTYPVMNRTIETDIDNRLKSFPLGSVSCSELETIEATTQPIESIDTATDNTAIAVLPIDKTIQSRFPITSDELLKVTELLDSHNTPKTNKTKNQDKTPLTDTESLQSRFNDGMWLSTKEIIDLLSPTVDNLNKNTLNKRTMNEEKKIGEKRLTDIGIETYQDEKTKHRFYRKIAIAE